MLPHCLSHLTRRTDLLPSNADGYPETKEFLQSVVDILFDFIQKTFDRNEKVIDFHHPEELRRLLDLHIPEQGVTIEQLLQDCSQTLKFQVKTGQSTGQNRSGVNGGTSRRVAWSLSYSSFPILLSHIVSIFTF